MKTPTEYADAHAKMVFALFEARLKPLMEEIAPDWLLHHIVMHRRPNYNTIEEEVEIRLIIRPIGLAHEVRDHYSLEGELKQLAGPAKL